MHPTATLVRVRQDGVPAACDAAVSARFSGYGKAQWLAIPHPPGATARDFALDFLDTVSKASGEWVLASRRSMMAVGYAAAEPLLRSADPEGACPGEKRVFDLISGLHEQAVIMEIGEVPLRSSLSMALASLATPRKIITLSQFRARKGWKSGCGRGMEIWRSVMCRCDAEDQAEALSGMSERLRNWGNAPRPDVLYVSIDEEEGFREVISEAFALLKTGGMLIVESPDSARPAAWKFLAECADPALDGKTLSDGLACGRKTGRHLWAFDSFEGLPRPTEKDGDWAFRKSDEWGGAGCEAPEADFRETLFGIAGLQDENVHIRKGWFKDTMPGVGQEVGPIAILRLDGDWYDCVLVCLEHLYDRVVPGGYILIDDYGYWEGARKATDEFRAKRGIASPLIVTDHEERYWMKLEENGGWAAASAIREAALDPRAAGNK